MEKCVRKNVIVGMQTTVTHFCQLSFTNYFVTLELYLYINDIECNIFNQLSAFRLDLRSISTSLVHFKNILCYFGSKISGKDKTNKMDWAKQKKNDKRGFKIPRQNYPLFKYTLIQCSINLGHHLQEFIHFIRISN